MMSAFVKIVAFVGFASMASATHDCLQQNLGAPVYCGPIEGCPGNDIDLRNFLDIGTQPCGTHDGVSEPCCTSANVCPPCEYGCDPDFVCDGIDIAALELED